MLYITLICLSLYGISSLNGDITTAATTESINAPQNQIPEGYFEKNQVENLDKSLNENIYPAEINIISK